MKRIVSLFLAICTVIMLTVPAFAAATPSATDWMGKINGELTLAQFTIPGTHDSTTQYCVLGRCQNVGVKEQLKYGVRFLDIRLKNDDGRLNCYHGVVNCNVSFSSVMEQVSDFLKAHPTECVIMSIMDEGGDGGKKFERALVETWIESKKYADLFYTDEAIPKLNEVRGKIVLVRRYTSFDKKLCCGLNAKNNWPSNSIGTIENSGYKIAVQDHYKYNTIGTNYGKDKWQYFISFDKTIQKIDAEKTTNCLCLNYASGTNLVGCGMLACANTVNSKINSEFSKASGNHGVVIMDYVTAKVAKTVYGVNF